MPAGCYPIDVCIYVPATFKTLVRLHAELTPESETSIPWFYDR